MEKRVEEEGKRRKEEGTGIEAQGKELKPRTIPNASSIILPPSSSPEDIYRLYVEAYGDHLPGTEFTDSKTGERLNLMRERHVNLQVA